MQTAKNTAPIHSRSDALRVSNLYQRLEQKDQLIADHEKAIVENKHIIEKQQKLLKLLEERLPLARQKRFGSSSERLPFQGDFFDEAELEQALSDIEAQLQDIEKPSSKRPRMKLECISDILLRMRVELLLSEEEKAVASQTFFTKVKEELDIFRPQARVLEYWQERAVFPMKMARSVIQALHVRPILWANALPACSY